MVKRSSSGFSFFFCDTVADSGHMITATAGYFSDLLGSPESDSCALWKPKTLVGNVLSSMCCKRMKWRVREMVETNCPLNDLCAWKTGLDSKDFSFSNTGGRTYGIPSVRTDLTLPNPRRVSDKTNYGDSSSAWALLHPSIYTLNGVHEEHFNCPRSKAEVRTWRRATTTTDSNMDTNISSWLLFA